MHLGYLNKYSASEKLNDDEFKFDKNFKKLLDFAIKRTENNAQIYVY